jgi:hypothetical protein
MGGGEWAWRRGHRDGTIVVALARPRVIDLAPERSATRVAAGLAQQPRITVVSRDRSADGMRRGAPQAVPVSDLYLGKSDSAPRAKELAYYPCDPFPCLTKPSDTVGEPISIL